MRAAFARRACGNSMARQMLDNTLARNAFVEAYDQAGPRRVMGEATVSAKRQGRRIACSDGEDAIRSARLVRQL